METGLRQQKSEFTTVRKTSKLFISPPPIPARLHPADSFGLIGQLLRCFFAKIYAESFISFVVHTVFLHANSVNRQFFSKMGPLLSQVTGLFRITRIILGLCFHPRVFVTTTRGSRWCPRIWIKRGGWGIIHLYLFKPDRFKHIFIVGEDFSSALSGHTL